MKNLALVFVGMFACCLLAADGAKLTLAEAREQITAAVNDPEKMGEIMKQLSAEDQQAFMVEVNKAISALPGSNEAKTAKSLSVNREGLVNAQKGNLQALVAKMFSSVSLESLTVLAERYGEDLFNRAADATKTFTDEQFTEIASSTVGEVKKECEGLPDAAPRDTLAIYLFERASNGSIPDLEDRLLEIAISDPQLRAVAKNEWLASANGTGPDRFSALLGYAEAGRAANVDVVLRIAGPQMLTAQLNDLAQGVMDASGRQIMPLTQGEYPSEHGLVTPGQAAAVTAEAQGAKPISALPVPWNPQYSRKDVEEAHPGGYQWQK